MITKEAILLLLGDRPVAYHPMLAKKLGGVESAVFASQLLYWTGKGKLPGGWIFKTQAEFEEETGLTRRNQETARRKLKEIGALEEDLRGVPATMHYRLNLDIMAEILSDTRQSSMAEPAKLDCTDQPNLIGRTSQTPEITTENTIEHITPSKKQKNNLDPLADTFNRNGQKDNGLFNERPADQWLQHRDAALAAFERAGGKLGYDPNERQTRKGAITEFVAELGDKFDLKVWEQAITESILNGVGSTKVARFFEVYEHGGSYKAYIKAIYGDNDDKKGTVIRTKDGGYYL